MAEIYLERSRLDAIADAILKIEPCAFTGTVTRDQIIMALGEAGDIWPSSIMEDAFHAAVMERECIAARQPA